MVVKGWPLLELMRVALTLFISAFLSFVKLSLTLIFGLSFLWISQTNLDKRTKRLSKGKKLFFLLNWCFYLILMDYLLPILSLIFYLKSAKLQLKGKNVGIK